MNFTVNSASLNGSSGSNLVVASILSGLLALAGTADANLRISAAAVNGNVGTVTTALANQRVVSSSVGSVVVTGSATSIRYKVYSSSNSYLHTVGNASANYIADGSSSVQLVTSGSILPNFKVDVEVLPGSSDLSGDANSLILKVVKCNPGIVSLQVDLVTPNVVPIIDLYVVTSLNGYLIPANHLGYGEAGSLNTEMGCEAVRIVPAQAHGRLWEDGPQLITNDAATLKHVGYLPTTGVTNVAIKIKPQNHFTWYYEDWLTLNIGSMEVVPRLFTGIVDAVGRITTTITAEAAIRRAPMLYSINSAISGPSVTSILSAGSISPSLEFNLTGNSLQAVVIKEGYSTGTLVTKGSTSGLRTVYFSAVNMFLNTTGTLTVNRARIFTAVSGVLSTTVTALWYVNTTSTISSGNVVLIGNTTGKVYKHSYSNGNISLNGVIDYNIAYRVKTSVIGTTGYCYGAKVVTEEITSGAVTMFNGPLDGRVVIKGVTHYGYMFLNGAIDEKVVEPVYLYSGVLTTDGAIDEKVVEPVYLYSGVLTTDGAITPNYNEVVYIDFVSSLTGETFAITNLFVKAEESRSASVPSSPYAQNTSLHYIVIPE